MNRLPPKAQSSGPYTTGGRGRATFPQAARLLKHADFERVYELGQKHFARHLTFFFLPRAGERARVGFTVGSRLGGAVERNRIKRRLREAVRREHQRLEPGVDVVVNPKKSVLQAEFLELIREVAQAFDVISGKLGARAIK